MKNVFDYLKILLLAALVSALMLLAYDYYFAMKIVAVDFSDVSEYMAQLRTQYAKEEIGEEELHQGLEYVKQFLEQIPDNYVVLREEAVLKNAQTMRP